jgi:hypothetical protein
MPKREMSKRLDAVAISSIAQQARPIGIGHSEFLRIQLMAASTRVTITLPSIGSWNRRRCGTVQDTLDAPEKAIRHWEEAVRQYEQFQDPPLLEIATLANNLGFLKKAEGDHDAAETHFLRALEILHSQLGQDHEQTATVASNLGALYHAAGYFEQAREIHMMALDTRRKLFGEAHHDTAQSHNNLALALLRTGDRSWARRHFEKALAGFETLGPACHEDLEAVAANYCDYLREEGDASLAATIESRVREVIAAPSPAPPPAPA